ncbi:two-component system, chemotaxis family, response regulator CheB [Proteiniborus sp. DW1]|uniref:protein-glutamate methylesterase/protein-glutamine glutaminase n=1 Tax=Proteiniborus sp. DW1 TaxID=1889883 RepID=UPI00092DEF95|nr:chemotaxis response regulator protein-glutamate methylesterase [Proteiniborus sp. DW1]SCG83429.1 two-component system, chemotaxis family, response regulator CheB [Proteiniborus sp. DW1]
MTIKVMVIDDSAFMRKIISDSLKEDKDIDVPWTAKNGQDALKQLNDVTPDVITLDIEMPIMDGISTLREIVRLYNIPVIMLSSLTVSGADSTIKALEIGAFDFVTKPTNIFKLNNEEEKHKLIEKVKIAAQVKRNSKSNTTLTRPKKIHRHFSSKEKESEYIISIGTSTGGPKALQLVIPQIPANINGSILVVQHMPKGFTKSLASRLDSMSNIRVKEAEDGERLLRGHCYIAPGNYHMTAHQEKDGVILRLNQDAVVSGHRPSVDVMMKSVAEIKNYNKIGIIMTGMGSDGANGMKSIFDSGGYTIAQDEESSIVYGMPKSAINNGCVNKILPLNEISNEIISILGV